MLEPAGDVQELRAESAPMTVERIERLIVDVPDFPRPGVMFKDITPLLADPDGFAAAVQWMADAGRAFPADGILAVESRGFIFGAALAHVLRLPMHLVRKRGKLPRDVVRQRYALE